MNEQRFDRLARSLGSATSRRQMLKVLLGSALGGGGLLLQRRQAAAITLGNCTTRPDGLYCADTGALCILTNPAPGH
jgi:hypothetical protein